MLPLAEVPRPGSADLASCPCTVGARGAVVAEKPLVSRMRARLPLVGGVLSSYYLPG